ncbi:ExeM/NucH family extracellular endonuclease [Ornithinimicrobium faecis]|uniref:ExeM/NucH family extracellular endonuclease n=1 Tax=Ornithinimicrobium faecis TaxID=2934158 RepID=UPI002118D7E7|nr:ExeM/NucH family extracellular endonuclease [Ornithinimicrobium sp. HY1745]
MHARVTRRRTAAVGAASLVLSGLAGAAALPTVAAPEVAPAVSAAAADDLIISEYIEGSSNNKALEFYNGTGAEVALDGYTVETYSNGSDSAGLTLSLDGALVDGDTYVLAHSAADPAILAQADQTSGAGFFNGDDAIVLRDGAGAVVDSLGQVGVDPGSQWGSGDVSTADNTLRRLADICTGDTTPDDAFDPALEWAGFPEDTFDGLGSHTVDCGAVEPASPVINEFSISTTGTDLEFYEVIGAPETDYSDLSILQVEGDGKSNSRGSVITVDAVGSTDDAGLWSLDLPANRVQNGTLTLLLVSGYTGTASTVIDTDQDGVIDNAPWTEIVDSVAILDGNVDDVIYSETALTDGYDGEEFVPGAASRIPDGTDTDTTADWVRNDFNKAGFPGFDGPPAPGQAWNTPGAPNEVYEAEEPPPGGTCGDPVTAIGAVQGSGDETPMLNETVDIEGIVVGDFQEGGFDGYYVQDAGDGDPATSDGVFVYAPGGAAVEVGDSVRVTGTAGERFGMTQVSASAVTICATDGEVPDPIVLELPISDHERYEGMYVTFPEDLTILEYFNYGRYGQIALGTERQFQPTAVHAPGSPEAEALLAENLANRIMLDDGRGNQNPDPAIHPNGEEFTLDNIFRGGDLVTNATGVLDYRFDVWGLQPTQGADYTAVTPRPEVPEVGGDVTVGSFNVLNYFTTMGSRGADDLVEFDRQEAKIVAALAEMDADVVGLIEIENNNDVAVSTLTEALNAEVGAGTYEYVATGTIGTDEITTAFIYQPAEVTPVGDFATLTTEDDPRFLDGKNRPTLAQTFEEVATGEAVTVAVNHLKSKGSGCEDVGDPEDPDGQGNCNGVRTQAAEAMVDWLAQDPTGTGVDNTLIIGDLNAYDKEDPIVALQAGGFTDLLLEHVGEFAYSYVFDGQLGYLDHALANEALASKVTDAAAWTINADEVSLIDYDMSFKQDAQDALYAPDAFRSSDHDPVLIGLDLLDEPADTTPPELTVTVDSPEIWPPNNRWRDVETTIEATDDSGEPVTVTLVGATVEGPSRADIEVVSDTEFRVRAVKNAVYTITYEATDAAGNSTTASVTVEVPHDRGNNKHR